MTTPDLESRRIAIEERKLEADIQLRQAELSLEHEKLSISKQPSSPQPIWATPFGLGIVGGVLTLLTAIISNTLQSCSSSRQKRDEHAAQISRERQQFQSEFIQKAIERAKDTDSAAINLNFLWEAGLISDYPKIPEILKNHRPTDETKGILPSSQTFNPLLGSIRGRDDRIKVLAPSLPPYSSIYQIHVQSDTGKSMGTGFLVAPKVIITAAHNLDGATSVVVSPSGVGTGEGDSIISDQFRLPEEWREKRDLNFNYAAILLPSLPNRGIPLDFSILDDSKLTSAQIEVAGFPGDKSSGEMWTSSERINFLAEGGMGYDADTFGGMSGAPVLFSSDGTQKVVGIHYSSAEIRAVRITKAIKDEIDQWISEAGP